MTAVRKSELYCYNTSTSCDCAYNLPDAVTLGGAYDEGEALPMQSTGSYDLMQWAIGLQ